MKMIIPVSVGELLDKISILQIKSLFVNDDCIEKELKELEKMKSTITQYTLEYEIQLKRVNEKLWKLEDRSREKGKKQEFDDEFIEISKDIYTTNDERAEIKKRINEVCQSEYKEIKIY